MGWMGQLACAWAGTLSFFLSVVCHVLHVSRPHITRQILLFVVYQIFNESVVDMSHETNKQKKRKSRACTSHETELEDLEDFYGCNLPKK
jgi:hypothetical protein